MSLCQINGKVVFDSTVPYDCPVGLQYIQAIMMGHLEATYMAVPCTDDCDVLAGSLDSYPDEYIEQ
jgi:hypothetical protein